MVLFRRWALGLVLMAGAGLAAGASADQPPPGRPGGGMGMGGGMMMQGAPAGSDMEVFHFLLSHGSEIRRTVTQRDDGVETLTESDNTEIVKALRTHVAAMYSRVKDGRPIHVRDPLFREIFQHADQITMTMTPTDKGLRVVESSTDPYVVKLIKAHAEVVSRFIANGRREMMVDHAVPPKP